MIDAARDDYILRIHDAPGAAATATIRRTPAATAATNDKHVHATAPFDG